MEEESLNVSSLGRKIERIRKIKGISQETLAGNIGMTRQALARLEQSDVIEDTKLVLVAKGLGVTSDSIKHFNEEAIFNNNIFDQNNTVINNNFNPIEKIVELYERMLQREREIIEELKNKNK